jgi:hypothetical protein
MKSEHEQGGREVGTSEALLRILKAENDGYRLREQAAKEAHDKALARATEWANVAGLNGAEKDAAVLAGRHWQKRAEAAEALIAERDAEVARMTVDLDRVFSALDNGADDSLWKQGESFADAIRSLRARVAEMERINALRIPGSCQCGDDDLCAIARRAEAAEARNARLVAAARTVADYIEREIILPPGNVGVRVMTAAMERKMIKPLRDVLADNGGATQDAKEGQA